MTPTLLIWARVSPLYGKDRGDRCGVLEKVRRVCRYVIIQPVVTA